MLGTIEELKRKRKSKKMSLFFFVPFLPEIFYLFLSLIFIETNLVKLAVILCKIKKKKKRTLELNSCLTNEIN